MTRSARLLLLLAAVSTSACAATPATEATTPDRPPQLRGSSCRLPPGAHFARGLASVKEHDRSPWTKESCQSVVNEFLCVDGGRGPTAEALFNAGAVHERCGDSTRALDAYRAAAAAGGPRFASARVRIVALTVDPREPDARDRAIAEIGAAVRDAGYQSKEALVALARLQLARGGRVADGDGEDDLARAKKNCQRALALDSDHVPAYDALALTYLAMARREANVVPPVTERGPLAASVPAARLDLALFTAERALRQGPPNASLHNTIGLVHAARGSWSAAVQAFDEARRIDPQYVEAHLNWAFLHLAFHRYEPAEPALRHALTLAPDDYDARLGLALALRGKAGSSGDAADVTAARAELDRAEKIDPARPEVFFNRGVLLHELAAKDGAEAVASLNEAKRELERFVRASGADPRYRDAVAAVTRRSTRDDASCLGEHRDDPGCARGRLQDIDDTIKFFTEVQTTPP
jgi:tetratricopeptide (TPR) repeat protein